MKITAKIYKADRPNANGITYSADSLKLAVINFNKPQKYATCGQYPPEQWNQETTDINNIIGPVTLEFVDGYVVANIDLLNTPKGSKVKTLMEDDNVQPMVLPVAIGEYETVSKENDKFKLTGILQIICTCDHDVEVGDVEKDMYVATTVKDDNKQVLCIKCNDTGLYKEDVCEGRMAELTCDCVAGEKVLEDYLKEHPEDR